MIDYFYFKKYAWSKNSLDRGVGVTSYYKTDLTEVSFLKKFFLGLIIKLKEYILDKRLGSQKAGLK